MSYHFSHDMAVVDRRSQLVHARKVLVTLEMISKLVQQNCGTVYDLVQNCRTVCDLVQICETVCDFTDALAIRFLTMH
ncbi:hypothetical protein K1719_045308 [Acacia pycnantha]|nr:hypothetical protein K1719_045308 [Acacia pycnantha]